MPRVLLVAATVAVAVPVVVAAAAYVELRVQLRRADLVREVLTGRDWRDLL